MSDTAVISTGYPVEPIAIDDGGASLVSVAKPKQDVIEPFTIVANAGVSEDKNWNGNAVPLFKNPAVVYLARNSMRDNGSYDEFRDPDEDFLFTVPVGTEVEMIRRKWSGSIQVRIKSGPETGAVGWILEWNLNWQV